MSSMQLAVAPMNARKYLNTVSMSMTGRHSISSQQTQLGSHPWLSDSCATDMIMTEMRFAHGACTHGIGLLAYAFGVADTPVAKLVLL